MTIELSRQIGKMDLHRTGRDSLMGQLLRRFWHPIALADEIKPASAIPVRVMGEDLTLYRGESGEPHLIGGACAHRCTALHTGFIKGDDLSCMYHGWRYNAEGVCVDIPAEKRPRAHEIKIAAYPVREYGGLVFAYLGDGPAPAFDLPRKHEFEDPERTVIPKCEIWDCNWFQQVENSMDAVHLSFAHMWGVVGQFGSAISAGGEIPDLDYEETASGVRQIATRSNGNVRISDWTFPNNNHIVAPGPRKGGPWGHVSVWAVPIDDHRTMRYRLFSIAENDPDIVAKAYRDQDFDPASHAPKLFSGDLSGIPDQGVVSSQDYVAVRGQGVIVNRDEENLSSSDAGIIFLRKVFLRELQALRDGAPTKTWTKLSEKVDLPAPPTVSATA